MQDELAKPLSVLINQSFGDGIFPDNLKKAIIRPLLKKIIKTDTNDYRPIAIIPTISKVFERKVCERYKTFSEHQNGFRK